MSTLLDTLSPREYQRRITAWSMYDWANSAFVTTIMAAVLPVYFSQVAGKNLPSAARATAYWSVGLTISLLIVAILSPILGTVSDVARSKKRFLAIFASIGIFSTALLVLVDTGDWMLASILAILGRIGLNGSVTFYDALLPHVAKPADQDRVSARGYALGYLGGGLLLAINVVMIDQIPGNWGVRLSFVSVAIWWAVFTIPLLRIVPEPPAVTTEVLRGRAILDVSFKRMAATIKDIRHYRELFKYLIAFLIYNDGIGTIIGVAAIYGAEMGFSSVELILALLLVQFVGIPFSLVFGRLPSAGDRRRPFYLAFVLYNLIALPLAGVLGGRLLPAEMSGARPPAYESRGVFNGQGSYLYADFAPGLDGAFWQSNAVSARQSGEEQGLTYAWSAAVRVPLAFSFHGQQVEVTYSTGPDHGIWTVEMDGQALLDEQGQALSVDAYNAALRYGEKITFRAAAPGEHVLTLINSGDKHADSQGTVMGIARLTVLPAARQSNLGVVLGMILAVDALGLILALALGSALFSGLAQKMDTKNSILLALVVYSAIAIWGYFIDSVVEFWFLAWMVAIVQGGSQALSRSLYAAMSPASKSGEFFGLFGVMEKFASLIGPALFAAAGLWFSSSRPAVLSLIVLFIIGGAILSRVNVAEGRQVAQQEDMGSR